MNRNVAIDGPAGSGKGTITKLLAEKLDLITIDTGAMYRCVALESLRKNYSLEDKEKIAEIAQNINIDFDEEGHTFLNGEDVSKEIREKAVTQIVSFISSIVPVREALVKKQQELAKGKDVIMEGRDITTVVLPDAKYKFYLDASIDERVKRRFLQNQESGIEMTLEEIKENISKREYNDMHKEVGSLMRTDDQIYIDSSNLSTNEVLDLMLGYIKE